MGIHYTGIGSRQTPDDVLMVMKQIAGVLEKQGMILRSGGTDGADLAFQEGVTDPENMEIYIPWNGFNGLRPNQKGVILPKMDSDLYKIAAHFHPNWSKLKDGVKKLHARNIHQIVGPDIHANDGDMFSRFVLCWTPNGKGGGGTGQALRLARFLKIPVFDFGQENALQDFSDFMEK